MRYENNFLLLNKKNIPKPIKFPAITVGVLQPRCYEISIIMVFANKDCGSEIGGVLPTFWILDA